MTAVMTAVKLNVPSCPRCGGPAQHLLEMVQIAAELQVDAEGCIEYTGNYAELEGTRTVPISGGRVTLFCARSHPRVEWQSGYEYEEAPC